MALSCFFALSVDDGKTEVREAGALPDYNPIGTLALFAMFSLLSLADGSFLFPVFRITEWRRSSVHRDLFRRVLGFGLKAGLIPLHIWLPSAHANAPSHVSAIMSGVLIQMGIYGLLRTFSFFGQIPLCGAPLFWSPASSQAFSGRIRHCPARSEASARLQQHREHRHHHHGVGVAMIGRQPALLFSPCSAWRGHCSIPQSCHLQGAPFFSAGSAIHSAGSREIDRMGGLGRLMPWTAFSFLVGAVAICGLPPLNGFVSEFLVYLGLFHGVRDGHGAALPFLALAAPALAFIGGLAMACFVKVYGVAFLGLPRSESAAGAHESGWWMRAPMLLLVLICLIIGICPPVVAPMLDAAIASWQPSLSLGGSRLEDVAPLWWLSLLATILLASPSAWVLAGAPSFRRPSCGGPTGDCGYLNPARGCSTRLLLAEMLVSSSPEYRPHREVPSATGRSPVPDASPVISRKDSANRSFGRGLSEPTPG